MVGRKWGKEMCETGIFFRFPFSRDLRSLLLLVLDSDVSSHEIHSLLAASKKKQDVVVGARVSGADGGVCVWRSRGCGNSGTRGGCQEREGKGLAATTAVSFSQKRPAKRLGLGSRSCGSGEMTGPDLGSERMMMTTMRGLFAWVSDR